MPPRGLIFDCDGVLFESRQANLAYYNAVFARLGVPAVTASDGERAQICHTAASPQVFAALLEPGQVDEAMAIAQGLDYRTFIPVMVPEPDLFDCLERLAHHLPLAVATNRGDSMQKILDHFRLGDFFRTVVTCRDVARPKPAPDMLLLAARQLGLTPDEVLFVGDSELDREAARRAGMPFVAYGGGLAAGERWVECHRELADLVLSGMRSDAGNGAP